MKLEDLAMSLRSAGVRGRHRFGWFAIVLLAAASGAAQAEDPFQSAPGPEPAPQRAKPASRPPIAAPARPTEREAAPAVAAPSVAPPAASTIVPPRATGPTY